MGSALPHQNAWVRARDRYAEDLTAEERAMFNAATIETVFYDASAAEKKHAASSKTRDLMSKLDPFITAIEQYGEAIDVYSNAYPLVLSPLWGSVRVVLHLARAFGKYFEKLIDMFSSIGDVLPRFRIFERLFSNHELLIQALSKVYVDIISFCTEAKRVFRDGQRTTSSRIAFKLTWKPFERQFGGQIERFRRHRTNVEKEAGLAHMIEAADSRTVVLYNQMQLEADRQVNERLRLLEALSTVDYAAKHHKIQRARYDGTGGWLLKDEAYRTWKVAHKSACLRCSGIPGCGKTFLASRVIDDLLVVSDSTKPRVVYYYFDYAEPRTLQGKHLFEAIVKQLIMGGLVSAEVECQLRQSVINEARVPGETLLQKSIFSTVEASRSLYVILDGLDECENETRRDVTALIEHLLVRNEAAVRILVSCREDEHILRSLDVHPCIQLSEPMMATDIDAFITGSVRSKVRSGELRINSPALEEEIVAELVTKAHGLFLWVYLQLEELCEAPPELIGEILRDLPEGLAGTYRRILLKLQKSAWKTKIAAKAFRWIACAQRPLKIDELKEAIKCENSDKSWRDAASMGDEELVRSFGALVCLDVEDQTIRFVHHTVLQFLFTTEEISPIFHFSQAQAHSFVGEMCVVYLNFSDFETSLTHRQPERKVRDSAVFQPGAMSTIPTVLGVGRSLFRAAYRFYGGNKGMTGPTIDHDKLFDTRYKTVKPIEPVSSMLAKKYRLLDYVVAYWDYHTKWLGEDNMETWKSFRELAMNKCLPFEFRKWGLNEHYGSNGCNSCEPGSSGDLSQELSFTTLIHYAAQIGHVQLLRLFRCEDGGGLQDYVIHEQRSGPLLVACLNEQIDVLQYLLCHYAAWINSNMFNEALYGVTWWGYENALCTLVPHAPRLAANLSDALPLAIQRGHTPCAERLLEAGAIFSVLSPSHREALSAAIEGHLDSVIASLISRHQLNVEDVRDRDFTNHGPRGLTLAAQRGLTLTLKAMLETGAAIDDKDNTGRVALHYAADAGHIKAVHLLLEHNCNVNAYSATEETSIHLASKCGHRDIIGTLHEHGGDLNCKDFHQRTPLDLAIKYMRKDAETLLRELGGLTAKRLKDEKDDLDRASLKCLIESDLILPFNIEERGRSSSLFGRPH